MEPNALRLLNDAMTPDVDIVIGGVRVVYESGMEFKESDATYYAIPYKGVFEVNQTVMLSTYVNVWGKLFRKGVIERANLRFPRGLLYEDAYWHWAYLTQASRGKFIQTHVYKYFRREGSIMAATSARKPGKAIHHLWIVEAFVNFLKGNGLYVDYQLFISEILERYFWLAFNLSPDWERPRACYEAARIAREYQISMENHKNLQKIAQGDIGFLFGAQVKESTRCEKVISHLLPPGSKRREFAKRVANILGL